MSFLIDPPWLYATGRAYGRVLPEQTTAARARCTPRPPARSSRPASRCTSTGRWTRPIWEACRAEDGRDWMLNSGVLRLDHKRAARAHARRSRR